MKSAKYYIKFIYFKGIKKLRDSYSVKTLGFPSYYHKDMNAFSADIEYDYYMACQDSVFLNKLTRTELKVVRGVYR